MQTFPATINYQAHAFWDEQKGHNNINIQLLRIMSERSLQWHILTVASRFVHLHFSNTSDVIDYGAQPNSLKGHPRYLCSRVPLIVGSLLLFRLTYWNLRYSQYLSHTTGTCPYGTYTLAHRQKFLSSPVILRHARFILSGYQPLAQFLRWPIKEPFKILAALPNDLKRSFLVPLSQHFWTLRWLTGSLTIWCRLLPSILPNV